MNTMLAGSLSVRQREIVLLHAPDECGTAEVRLDPVTEAVFEKWRLLEVARDLAQLYQQACRVVVAVSRAAFNRLCGIPPVFLLVVVDMLHPLLTRPFLPLALFAIHLVFDGVAFRQQCLIVYALTRWRGGVCWAKRAQFPDK